jgi:uncharacterized protein involved in type VI secretion and phage assembly
MSEGQFWGKYRGVVSDVNDPLMQMRIKATVPDVYGDGTSGWAMPCAPFGGDMVGFFTLPTVGAGVWVEFEHGDPDYPIWTGCWWGAPSEIPQKWLVPPYKKVMLVTPAGHSITLDDSPGVGGITLETADGAKVAMSATGLEITNGTGAAIKLSGPQVSVNNGALDVT